MAKHINEFTELRKYRELAVRHDQLAHEAAHIRMDESAEWCDEDLEVLRKNAYRAVKDYYYAICDRLNKKTDGFYKQLDFADTFEPKRRFCNIFRKREL